MKQEERHVVLGSAGFIGKYLVDFLRNQSKNVLEWDIKNSVRQDCRIADLHLEKNDILYFLAWEVGGAKYLYDPTTQLDQLHNNLELMRNIFDQLEKSGCPFIFISSQLAGTNSVYGTLKKLGEVWSNQIEGSCVRLWNAYGAYEKYSERSHVVSDFIYQALKNGKITTLTSGEEERQFVHVKDICDAIQIVLDRRDNKVYDITSFEWVKIAEVAEIIASYTGVEVVFGKEKGITCPVLMKGKLSGWAPKVSFEKGIQETVDLYKDVLRGGQCLPKY